MLLVFLEDLCHDNAVVGFKTLTVHGINATVLDRPFRVTFSRVNGMRIQTFLILVDRYGDMRKCKSTWGISCYRFFFGFLNALSLEDLSVDN